MEPHIPLIASTFVSHYREDETLTPETYAQAMDLIATLGAISPDLTPLGYALLSIRSDPPPQDNEVTIDLTSGEILP
jgi:hypothetical protein